MSAVAVVLKELKFIVRVCLLNLRFFAAFNQRTAARYKAVGRAYYLKGIVKYFARCYFSDTFSGISDLWERVKYASIFISPASNAASSTIRYTEHQPRFINSNAFFLRNVSMSLSLQHLK